MITYVLTLFFPKTTAVVKQYAKPLVKHLYKGGLTLAFMLPLISAGTVSSLTLPAPGTETSVTASMFQATMLELGEKQTIPTVITAYSSTPDQTSSHPFITASGYHVTDGVIAANFLPFNTRVQIPKLFGDKIFVVKDRMNRRFPNRVDIWFPDRASAKRFGLRKAEIVIL